jgi:UDP-galactopyranose mutase
LYSGEIRLRVVLPGVVENLLYLKLDEREYPKNQTVIYREFSRKSCRNDEPYYPVNTNNDKDTLTHYETAAAQLPNVIFGGRLGKYQYLDMNKAIASALYAYEHKIKRHL